jgi:hypothetical protein
MHTATSGLTLPLLGVTRPLHLGNRGFEARVESGELQNRSRRVPAISDSITIAKMVIEASKAK